MRPRPTRPGRRERGEKGDDGGVKPLQSKEARNCVRLSPGKRRYMAIARSLDNDSMKLFSRVRRLPFFPSSPPSPRNLSILLRRQRQQVRDLKGRRPGRGQERNARAYVGILYSLSGFVIYNASSYISRLIMMFTRVPIAAVWTKVVIIP